ncbi:acid protease [Russula earlei]|uniref:Acid protease n=1 Tax=Russula earlei TaxID=71964 RepID=A0ACC0U4X6_9AGAM|nr:acid protease [Russula earlei]
MLSTIPPALLALLALSVAANPIVIRHSPVSLSFTRQLNVTGSNDLVLKDHARARGLAANPNGSGIPDAAVSLDVSNSALNYRLSVGIGNPATFYTLIMDTGSAVTWVGAGKAYVRTGTSVQTDNNVRVSASWFTNTMCQSVPYVSGSFSGTEFIDTVTISPGVVVSSQSIGVATTFHGFQDVDGILGLGPTNLTIGALSPSRGSAVPTITDNLFSQGTIASNMVSVSFEPTNGTSDKNGELTFGGTDSTKFTGNITFTMPVPTRASDSPITATFPASSFWGIDQSVSYGTSTSILNTTAGIVDTGTTLILIATDAFDRYRAATGAVPDNTTGLLRITPAQYADLESLFFTVGGTTFELTANAQIWPRALNSFIGGTAEDVYLIVHDLGRPSGQGLDFINGYTFLERFYAVFDTGNRCVGLATTSFTTATSN